MVKVLDACALMMYLEREPGYEKVKNLLVKAAETGNNLLMATVNWGEVFYLLIRNYGFSEAEKIINIIETFPIELVSIDLAITKQASFFKATKKLPYLDSFAAALTKLHKGELVTADKEFKLVENEIKIDWV